MASTVLPNGIIIPEKYSRDWYNDLYHNWQELDNLLGGGTPKDGTLTIQKNGDTVGTFSANQATNETINITVPDVNNGTLTIQKNGTTVDTFTANSSTDKTVDITVPTKTSDLTNDSGFITSDNTKIPLAGSNQISGSLIPSTDGTVNLGGSSYQWNNAYIKNYYYNGVQWGLDKANVWTGTQSFTSAFTRQEGTSSTHGYVIKAGFVRGSAPSTNTNLTFRWVDLNDNILGFLDFVATSSTYATRLNLRTENNGAQIAESIQLETNLTGSYFSFKPFSNGNVDLGSPTNKWKSFNGINPGALSLPSTSTGHVSIVSTVGQYLKDNNTNIYEFTAPFDGWVCVGIIKGSLRIDNNTTNISSGSENLGWWQCYTIPFMKNDSIQIRINKMDATDDYVTDIMWKAFIYPCQGNV